MKAFKKIFHVMFDDPEDMNFLSPLLRLLKWLWEIRPEASGYVDASWEEVQFELPAPSGLEKERRNERN